MRLFLTRISAQMQSRKGRKGHKRRKGRHDLRLRYESALTGIFVPRYARVTEYGAARNAALPW
jgi:hypothetical protein